MLFLLQFGFWELCKSMLLRVRSYCRVRYRACVTKRAHTANCSTTYDVSPSLLHWTKLHHKPTSYCYKRAADVRV